MQIEKPRHAPAAQGCLVGALRVPVKIVAVLVVLPVRVVWDLLAASARTLNRHVLGPAGQGLRWLHEHLLRPVLRGLGWTARTLLMLVFVWPWVGLWRDVAVPVGRAVDACLLRPLWRYVLAPVGGALLTYLLRPLAHVLGRYLLLPLGKGVAWVAWALGMALFVWPWVGLWRYVLAPVGVAAAWLARALFVWPWVALWRYAVVPVVGAAYRYVLAPLGAAAYAWVLAPLGRLLAGAWHVAGRISRAMGRGFVWLWRGLVARPWARIRRQVLTPAGHVVREVWRAGRAAVREARAEVRRALFGWPPREPARSRARTLGSTTAVGSTPAPEISLHEPQG